MDLLKLGQQLGKNFVENAIKTKLRYRFNTKNYHIDLPVYKLLELGKIHFENRKKSTNRK